MKPPELAIIVTWDPKNLTTVDPPNPPYQGGEGGIVRPVICSNY